MQFDRYVSVSEELSAPLFRAETSPKMEAASFSESLVPSNQTIHHISEDRNFKTKLQIDFSTKTKLRGFSPQANYTDRATAACRRS
jgi:hypothetical protein